MANTIPTPVRGVVQTSKGGIPDWLPPREHEGYFGFHCDERLVAALYHPNGDLFEVLDLEGGKCIWPERVYAPYEPGVRANSTVYFIQVASGEIKIGNANCANARLRKLQSANPHKLTLLATCAGGEPQEREYHTRFAQHRLVGEWFTPAPDILAEIERLNTGVQTNDYRTDRSRRDAIVGD